jgi:hypothetical protein
MCEKTDLPLSLFPMHSEMVGPSDQWSPFTWFRSSGKWWMDSILLPLPLHTLDRVAARSLGLWFYADLWAVLVRLLHGLQALKDKYGRALDWVPWSRAAWKSPGPAEVSGPPVGKVLRRMRDCSVPWVDFSLSFVAGRVCQGDPGGMLCAPHFLGKLLHLP